MDKVKPKKEEELGLLVRDGKKEKDRKIYPTIRINHDDFPDGKKMSVGEHHHIHLNVKMVGNSQSRFQNEGEFELRGIDHCDKGCDGEHHEHTMPAEEDGAEDKKDIDADHDDEDRKPLE